MSGSAKRWQGRAGWQPVTGGAGATPEGSGPALVVINPNSTQAVTDGIAAALTPLAGWGWPIRCVTLAEGPPGIEDAADAARVVPPMLALAADEPDALGFVVACFSDPGVPAMRAVVDVPVIGIGEAAYLAALATGERFGILSILPASIPRHAAALRMLALDTRCAGDRALGLGVTELADSARALPRMIEVARRLRDEDGADVLVLGCAGMAHARHALEDATGCPVIDPCQAGAALALTRTALGLSARSKETPHAR